ncbi:hypothetical protein [Flavobacterium suncheonense]|uniref:hypothetical protein n=1 Tax=Flavobacterium suncheonense TaxID=350894 RepID=UPI0012B627A7|nr:hypothetical protein [Flavobacterium suncheonense]
MHLEEINNRLDDLFLVLVYCSFGQRTFSTGQRICINQERAALLDRKNYLFDSLPLSEVRDYKVPEQIEERIQFTLNKITDIDWTAPVINL